MKHSCVHLVGGRVWVGIAVILLLGGCSRATQKARAREESHLKKLAVLYMQYASQHRGQGPASEAEFKSFIRSLPEAQRKSLGAQDVDALFVSERDGKPYVILYGVKGMTAPGPGGPGSAPVIGYEQIGQGGSRYVANSLGAVELLDENAFRQRVPGGKTQ